MLATYDVIHLMSKGRARFGVEAVLATRLRTSDDLSPYMLRKFTMHALEFARHAPLLSEEYARVEKNNLIRLAGPEKGDPP